MANFIDAFQPEGGINLDDLVGIFAGSIDPSVIGEAAPIGSLFIRSNGQLYQKINTGNTDWMVFSHERRIPEQQASRYITARQDDSERWRE